MLDEKLPTFLNWKHIFEMSVREVLCLSILYAFTDVHSLLRLM
jgi:hypothetical protein